MASHLCYTGVTFFLFFVFNIVGEKLLLLGWLFPEFPRDHLFNNGSSLFPWVFYLMM